MNCQVWNCATRLQPCSYPQDLDPSRGGWIGAYIAGGSGGLQDWVFRSPPEGQFPPGAFHFSLLNIRALEWELRFFGTPRFLRPISFLLRLARLGKKIEFRM